MSQTRDKPKKKEKVPVNAKAEMEGVAVVLAQPLVLYTGTDDPGFFGTLTSFVGTQEEFTQLFMRHNARQNQTAQMGAGIYATPNRQAALGYGRYLVRVTVQPGARFLDLTDRLVTSALRNRGVNPAQWGNANPNAVLKFNGDYHIIKTNLIVMSAG